MLETELTTVDLLKNHLPDESELPDSDDIPVDKDWSWRLPPAREVRNEDQNWIPNVLLMLLKSIWIDRADWFFGVDMAVYHTTGGNARVGKWYLCLSYWVNASREVVTDFVAAPTSQGKIIQAVPAPKRLRLKMIDRQWCRTE